MPVWEYKIISSGKGGFASPALLEKFLGDLGRDEWEIIHYQALPDNPLAFSGLARRPTQRDWTLQDAATAAAKAETEKLRAEFEAKFKGAVAGGGGEDPPAPFLEEKLAPDDGFRRPVDTSHDSDPDADEEEAKTDDWDKLTAAEEDELPTFFEAIRPHMRRNQRGPGMAVGVDYLAKKWDLAEEEIKGALIECGFVIPADEDAKPEYLEYDGDLYWLNENRRGELWINTKEKPRPIFRAVKAAKAVVEGQPEGGVSSESSAKEEGQRAEGGLSSEGLAKEEGQESGDRSQETGDRKRRRDGTDRKSERSTQSEIRNPQSEIAAGAPLPEGPAILDRIRPLMRRNRRGPGGSGSTSFLSRALKCSEADLKAAFAALGMAVPATAAEKPVFVEIGDELWWLNVDSRGGVWINGRERKAGETAASASAAEPTEAPAPTATAAQGEVAPADGEPATVVAAPDPDKVLAAVRLLLKETRTGAVAGTVERVAQEIGKSPGDLVAALEAAGLKVPEKAREKPVFVEHAGEIFWLNRNAKAELWLNAKASKYAEKKDAAEEGDEGVEGDGEKRAPRSRGKKKVEPDLADPGAK